MKEEKAAVDSIIESIDICDEIHCQQWFLQSMCDAIEEHWGEAQLPEHLSFLILQYAEKMQVLIPKLSESLNTIKTQLVSETTEQTI